MRYNYKYHLRKQWAECTEDEKRDGIIWYTNAYWDCVEIADKVQCYMPMRIVAAVVAVLSPRNRWERNLADAQAVIMAHELREPMPRVGTFNGNRDKAFRILHEYRTSDDKGTYEPTAHLGDRKVLDFYGSIVGGRDACCIDTWAVRAATGGKLSHVPNRKVYREVQNAYRTLAREYGLTAAEFQAIIWVHVRNGG